MTGTHLQLAAEPYRCGRNVYIHLKQTCSRPPEPRLWLLSPVCQSHRLTHLPRSVNIPQVFIKHICVQLLIVFTKRAITAPSKFLSAAFQSREVGVKISQWTRIPDASWILGFRSFSIICACIPGMFQLRRFGFKGHVVQKNHRFKLKIHLDNNLGHGDLK